MTVFFLPIFASLRQQKLLCQQVDKNIAITTSNNQLFKKFFPQAAKYINQGGSMTIWVG